MGQKGVASEIKTDIYKYIVLWYFHFMNENAETKEIINPVLPYTEIEVEPGLRLKQLEVSQAERVFNLIDQNREYLGKWLPFPDKTHEVNDSKSFIESMLNDRANNQQYGYGIEFEGEIVGHTSLMHLKDDKDPEIGYWIAQSASGKGITTKAVKALTAFGVNSLGLEHIIIRARPENIGSNKVAEKAGYEFIGQTDDEVQGLLNVWGFAVL
jgi:ribosomal-protein-serine acetyltransferase